MSALQGTPVAISPFRHFAISPFRHFAISPTDCARSIGTPEHGPP
jgi:hypothetical protein